jgi:hypothetical protein
MARPSAKVLFEAVIEEPGDPMFQIIEPTGTFTLAYKGKPAAIRIQEYNQFGLGMRYPKSSFPNRGHCERLVIKLNERFNTTDFSVLSLT